MPPTKAIIFLFVLISVNDYTWGKSLSIYEQKKYEKMLQGQGLYSPEDDVDILTQANFRNLVFNQPNAWLIEFYNSWCGFCQRFAPSWKALATDTKLWKRMVNVGAIDCSDDENSAMCREFEIMGYPTLRYFHEFYQHGIGTDLKKGTDMEEHKQNLLKHMIEEQQKGRGKMFPNLLPYKYSTLSNLKAEIRSDSKYAFLIIDNADTMIGPQLELDFNSIPEMGIRYANFNNSNLLNTLNIKRLPSMVVLEHNNNNELYRFPVNLETREDFRQAIIDFVKPYMRIEMRVSDKVFTGKWLEAEVPDISTLLQEKEKQAIRQKIKEIGDAVYQVDLETALRRSLKNEVATHKEIKGEPLLALRNYVNVLRKYFPFGPNGQIFLMTLFNLVNSRSVVSGEEIANIIRLNEEANTMVFSSRHDWMACEGSTSAKRGFPCGLWKLFHYLTVQAAEGVSDPKEVLYAMHGYIKNFFGCADCSKHFQDMAVKRDIDQVSTLNSAILWLWSAHNEVNERLAGDDTEDPEFPKVVFPTQKNCPLCRELDGKWNYPEVLRYLKTMYSRSNIKYLGSDVRVLQHGLPRRVERSISLFEQVESMCFILYVISFIIIIVLIRLFLKRGYRKKMYAYDLLGKV